jgi:hypothetical protein
VGVDVGSIGRVGVRVGIGVLVREGVAVEVGVAVADGKATAPSGEAVGTAIGVSDGPPGAAGIAEAPPASRSIDPALGVPFRAVRVGVIQDSVVLEAGLPLRMIGKNIPTSALATTTIAATDAVPRTLPPRPSRPTGCRPRRRNNGSRRAWYH